MKYFFLACTLLATVYGQLIIKYRSDLLSDIKGTPLQYLVKMITDIFVLSGFIAAAIAALFWMLAIKELPVSYAYPYMALSFILVPLGGHFLFGESVSVGQLLGFCLITAGVAASAVLK